MELFSEHVKIQKTPTLINFPDEKNGISKLAAGTNHVLALTESGSVYTWGIAYEQGQLGRRLMARNRNKISNAFTPRKLALKNIKDIFSGSHHSFALDKDGAVWAWGLNNYGQTGVLASKNAGEDSACVMVPDKIHCADWSKPGEEEEEEEGGRSGVVSIAAGNKHSLALTKDGKCFAWGQLNGCALGFKLSDFDSGDPNVVRDYRGTPRILKKPTRIPNLPKLRYVATGGEHSVAIAEDGKVYTWGFNNSCQTGHSGGDDIETPKMIDRKAVVDKVFVWAGAGGMFTVLAEEA